MALNYLLSNQNPNRKIYLGDTTVVYWADTADRRYASAFYAFLNPEYQQRGESEEGEEGKAKRKRDKSAEETMSAVAEKVEQGKPLDLQALREGLDVSMRFYVLGLAPSAARLAVRFFITDPFEKIADTSWRTTTTWKSTENMITSRAISPLWRILDETVSKKAKDRAASPLLAGAVMRAILTGAPYPAALYNAMITRIRADMDETERRAYPRSTTSVRQSSRRICCANIVINLTTLFRRY